MSHGEIIRTTVATWRGGTRLSQRAVWAGESCGALGHTRPTGGYFRND